MLILLAVTPSRRIDVIGVLILVERARESLRISGKHLETAIAHEYRARRREALASGDDARSERDESRRNE